MGGRDKYIPCAGVQRATAARAAQRDVEHRTGWLGANTCISCQESLPRRYNFFLKMLIVGRPTPHPPAPQPVSPLGMVFQPGELSLSSVCSVDEVSSGLFQPARLSNTLQNARNRRTFPWNRNARTRLININVMHRCIIAPGRSTPEL